MREHGVAHRQDGTSPPGLSKHGRTVLLLMTVFMMSLHSTTSKSVQMHSIKPDEDSFSLPIGFSMAAPSLRSGSVSGATASALTSSSSGMATASTSSDRPAGPVLHHFKKFTTPTTYSPSTASTTVVSTTPTIVYAGSYSQQKYSQPQAQYQPQYQSVQTKKEDQYPSQYQSQSSQQSQYQTQKQPYYQSQESKHSQKQYQTQESQTQPQYKSQQSQTQPQYQTQQSQTQPQYKSQQSQTQPQYQTQQSQKEQQYQTQQYESQQDQDKYQPQSQNQYQAQQYLQQSQYKQQSQYPQTQQFNEVHEGETYAPSGTTQRVSSSTYYQPKKPATYSDPQSPQDEQSLFQKQHSYQKLQKYQNQNQQSYHNTMSVYNAQQSLQNDYQTYQTLQQTYQQKPMSYHNYAGSSTPVVNAVSIEEAVAAAAAVTQRPTTASYEKYYEAIAATATTPAPRDTSPRYQYWKRKWPQNYQYYKPHVHEHPMSSYSRVVPPPAYRRVAAHRGPQVQHYYHGPYTMEAALPMSSTSTKDHSSHSWLDHALSPVKRDDSLLSSIGAPAGSSTALLNGLLVPIVLLGLSIPALGFAYTYLNRRRDFGGDFTSYISDLRPNEETLNQYLRFLQTAVECYQDPKKHNC